MMESEWTERTEHEPTPDEWLIISQVYTFHPLIGEVTGKTDMAKLFKLGGLGLIEALLPAADKAMIFEQEVRHEQNNIEIAKAAVAAAKERVVECEALVPACEQGLQRKITEFRAWKARFHRYDRR